MKVTTSDKTTIDLPKIIIEHSKTLTNLIKDIDSDTDEPIPLPDIDIETLQLLSYVFNECTISVEKICSKDIDILSIFKLLHATNFLDISELLVVLCEVIANKINMCWIQSKCTISDNEKIMEFDWFIRSQIYKHIQVDALQLLLETIKDYDCLYMMNIATKKPIDKKYMITLQHDDMRYKKLYDACPIISNFPKLENTIIAGGIINIAMDTTLNYIDFPTNDIDIFVCGSSSKNELVSVLDYFNKLGATFKTYYQIINAYVPNYHRTFQIIWHHTNTVYDCITNFHASHVKCGLYMGDLIMTPDCQYSLCNKISIIADKKTNAYTLKKIIKRGYVPLNYGKYTLAGLEIYDSVKKHDNDVCMIEQQKNVSFDKLMEDREYPIIFKHYAGMSDLERPLASPSLRRHFSQCEKFASGLTPPDVSDKMIMLSRNWSFKPYEYTTVLRRRAVFTDLLFQEGINFPVLETKLNWGLNITKQEAIDIIEPTDKINCPMRTKLRHMAQQCWQMITPEIAFGDVLPLLNYNCVDGSIKNYIGSQLPISERYKYIKYRGNDYNNVLNDSNSVCFYGYNGWVPDINRYSDNTMFTAQLVQINHRTYNCFNWFIRSYDTHDFNGPCTRIYEMPEKKLVAHYISAKVTAVGNTDEYNELIKYIAETYGICPGSKHKALGSCFTFNGKQYEVKKR